MEKGYSNKICGRQPLKNFSRSMFEYFPYGRFVNSRYERVKTLTLRREYFLGKTLFKNNYKKHLLGQIQQ